MSQEEAKLLNRHWEPERGEVWPEFGELDGRPVRLADVEETLPMKDWPNVVVEHPELGSVRPWRGLLGF